MLNKSWTKAKESCFSVNHVILHVFLTLEWPVKFSQPLVDCLAKRKKNLSVFVCLWRARKTASWSLVCWASFAKFSNKIIQHSLLPFVADYFCIIRKWAKINFQHKPKLVQANAWSFVQIFDTCWLSDRKGIHPVQKPVLLMLIGSHPEQVNRNTHTHV